MSSYLMKSELFQYNPVFTKEFEAKQYHLLENTFNIMKDITDSIKELAEMYSRYNNKYESAVNAIVGQVRRNPDSIRMNNSLAKILKTVNNYELSQKIAKQEIPIFNQGLPEIYTSDCKKEADVYMNYTRSKLGIIDNAVDSLVEYYNNLPFVKDTKRNEHISEIRKIHKEVKNILYRMDYTNIFEQHSWYIEVYTDLLFNLRRALRNHSFIREMLVAQGYTDYSSVYEAHIDPENLKDMSEAFINEQEISKHFYLSTDIKDEDLQNASSKMISPENFKYILDHIDSSVTYVINLKIRNDDESSHFLVRLCKRIDKSGRDGVCDRLADTIPDIYEKGIQMLSTIFLMPPEDLAFSRDDYYMPICYYGFEDKARRELDRIRKINTDTLHSDQFKNVLRANNDSAKKQNLSQKDIEKNVQKENDLVHLIDNGDEVLIIPEMQESIKIDVTCVNYILLKLYDYMCIKDGIKRPEPKKTKPKAMMLEKEAHEDGLKIVKWTEEGFEPKYKGKLIEIEQEDETRFRKCGYSQRPCDREGYMRRAPGSPKDAPKTVKVKGYRTHKEDYKGFERTNFLDIKKES